MPVAKQKRTTSTPASSISDPSSPYYQTNKSSITTYAPLLRVPFER